MITGWQLFALQPVWKVLALQPVWNVLQVKYLHCNQCEKTNENRQKMDLSHNQGLSPDKIIGWELFALHNVCTVFALCTQCKVFAKCLHSVCTAQCLQSVCTAAHCSRITVQSVCKVFALLLRYHCSSARVSHLDSYWLLGHLSYSASESGTQAPAVEWTKS